MKKTLLKAVAVCLCFVLFSFPVSSVSVSEKQVTPTTDAAKVMETRFLNMLNHNYVYGADFEDLEKTVNNAALALLDLRDSEDSEYISQDIVNGYLYDMYAVTFDDFSCFNTDFPQREGYLYILPRGFWKYEHKIISVTQNEDGTFTVLTDVNVKTHDRVDFAGECKTMFAENSESSFGYNIVFSEFVGESL